MHMNHPDTYGAAVWADPQDIAFRYRYNPETDFFLGRNPYNFHDAIGVNDDTHVFLCAGTRLAKGRSIVINNLTQWRGSVVSVDPKGENASICATRRADGDDYCTGLGQKTYVLDPYNRAQVPDELRASCNLLDVLDANSGSLLSECVSLANAMRMPQDGGESESWSKDAAEITGLVIAHVKTYRYIEDDQRNLLTVRDFLVQGQQDGIEAIKEMNRHRTKLAREIGGKPKLLPVPEDAYELLFEDMVDNDALRGTIARRARGLLNLMRSNVRQWGSLIQNARTETNFIDDLQMIDQLGAANSNGRTFKITDLRHDPNGISVFLCLPDKPEHPAIRWQKALLTLMLDFMGEKQGLPETDRQVLMVLDEFASMGKMPMILDGMGSIAGAGVKLFVIITQIGDLMRHYGEKAWAKIPANCGTQIWMGNRDLDTKKYIEQDFGEAEITLYQQSGSATFSAGTSENESTAIGEGETETFSDGRSDGVSESASASHTKGHNQSVSVSDVDTWQETQGRSKSSTRGHGSSWNISDSVSRGENSSTARNHQFSVGRNGHFDPFVRSTNDGRGTTRSSGRSSSTSRSNSRGGNISYSDTEGTNFSTSKGGSHGTTTQTGTSESNTQSRSQGRTSTLSQTYAQGHSRQRTQTKGTGRNFGVSIQRGVSESIQKRPLISVPEIGRYLGKINQRDHPAYPGFALVRIDNEEPMLVRKCYYDQDPIFEGCFTPHYAYAKGFLPFSKQRLVGGQYTDRHFLPIRLPQPVLDTMQSVDVDLKVTSDQWFDEGDPLFSWIAPFWDVNRGRIKEARRTIPQKKIDHLRHGQPYQLSPETVEKRSGAPIKNTLIAHAPADGFVVDYAEAPAFDEDGDIMLVRLERPFDDFERRNFEQEVFFQIINFLQEHGAAQAEIDRMIAKLNAQYRADWQKAWDRYHEEEARKEEERRRREAERKRREEEEAKRREAEEEARRQRALDAKIKAKFAERDSYIEGYTRSFLIAWVIIPIVIAFYAVMSAAEIANYEFGTGDELGFFDASTQYENKRFTDWNGYIKNACVGPARNIQQHWWGRYTYTCRAKVGLKTTTPQGWFGLVWLGWWFSVLYFVPRTLWQYFNYGAQARESENGWDDRQKEFFGEGYDKAKEWIVNNAGKVALYAVGTIICLIIYHNAVAEIYGF